MRWKNAVLEAVVNLTNKLNSPHFTRQQLLNDGLEKVLEATQTLGATPSQTLSRELQHLRDRNILRFAGRGHYTFMLEPDLKSVEDSTPLESARDTEGVEYTSATVRRPKRDTALVLSLKKMYEYRCQFCNTRLELPRFYAEAHHVKPLGSPHSGPDNLANLLVVCPNHHALLDYGGIYIEPTKLRLEHDLSPVFVQYHNEVIFGR